MRKGEGEEEREREGKSKLLFSIRLAGLWHILILFVLLGLRQRECTVNGTLWRIAEGKGAALTGLYGEMEKERKGTKFKVQWS